MKKSGLSQFDPAMNTPVPKRWDLLSALPILAGLYWLLAAHGGKWLLLGIVPGSLMFMSGLALLLMPGDRRITQYMAAGGFLGALLLPLVWIFGSFGDALAGGLLAVAAFLVAGRSAIDRDPGSSEAPAIARSLAMDAKVALDEAMLAYFVASAKIPGGATAGRLGESVNTVASILQERGWLENPAGMHPEPPPPERVYVQQARIYGREYERISYPSGFKPDPALPGAVEWGAMSDNAQCTAWVLRHPGPPRPWLLGIHGYRMGEPWLDMTLFSPRWLHERLGVNLFLPVLPLHGPRRAGLRSGDRFLDGDPLHLLHAETQALWDLRRALAWLRAQDENARIGVLGFSLGGYNAALLAQHDSGLDFVIAGIPVVDLATALWRHLPPEHLAYYPGVGLGVDLYRRILTPVSPLALPPKVAVDRRYIFAGVCDRLAVPDQALLLAKHWEVPVQWYQGAHLTFRGEPVVKAHVEAAMHRAGWPISPELAPVG